MQEHPQFNYDPPLDQWSAPASTTPDPGGSYGYAPTEAPDASFIYPQIPTYPGVPGQVPAPDSQIQMYAPEGFPQPVSGVTVDAGVVGGGYPDYSSASPFAQAAGGTSSVATTNTVHWRRIGTAVLIVAGLALLLWASQNYLKPQAKPRAANSTTSESIVADGANAAASATVETSAGSPTTTTTIESARATNTKRTNKTGKAQRGNQTRGASAKRKNAMNGAASKRARTVRGSGDSPLPLTGASSWLIALFGVMFLSSGLVVQRRAVEIGNTASLFQRGPLLRPLELIESLATALESDNRGSLGDRLVDLIGGPARETGFTRR